MAKVACGGGSSNSCGCRVSGDNYSIVSRNGSGVVAVISAEAMKEALAAVDICGIVCAVW